jgi:membrane protease YdiL (CAAX protease family)
MTLAAWAAWLPFVLPALLIQTATEELVFRGFLLQGLAARFRSRWFWWLLPAALFGLLHWNPAEFGPNTWIVALSTAAIGLILADVTVRTGNLSAAIGLHFANNVASLLVVALPSPLASLSLWVARVDTSDAAAVRPLLLADLATTLAAYAVWLALCHRRRRLHSRGGGSI